VLGFSGSEVADTLETTPASVYSALQRAHKAIDERLPEQSQQATLRSLGNERVRELVDQFVSAWERGDVDAVVGLLAEDAAITMPPIPTWFSGRDAVASFLASRPLAPGRRWRTLPAQANAQPALGFYMWTEDAQAFLAHDIVVLTLEGGSIGEITAFLDADVFAGFGLPGSIR
jgi:RNA polymerase sigma-70 factor (ECF subfamily)